MPDFQFDLAPPPPIVFNLLGDNSSLTIGDAAPNVLLSLSSFMRGDKGDKGDKGDPGVPGPAGGSSYTHHQNSPASIWNVVHNLNRFPSITVVDSTERIVEGDEQYIDANNVTLNFSAPFAGLAYLN